MSQAACADQVLVTDDSPVYRQLVEQILSCDTYSLLFARDGAEALRRFQQHSPSADFTDWILPDFSGIELFELIRSDNSRPANSPTKPSTPAATASASVIRNDLGVRRFAVCFAVSTSRHQVACLASCPLLHQTPV